MRFTRIMNLSKKVTKYRERTVLDNYKKDTFISQHSETHSGSVGWEDNARPIRPVEVPSYNGVTQYIPQLARMVIKVSTSSGSSAELRRFIDFVLPKFAEENPCAVIYVRAEDSSPPSVAAEWLDETRQIIRLTDFSINDIIEKFAILSHQSTAEEPILRPKNTSTQKPSIQGFAYHFLNDPKPLMLAELPETKVADSWNVEIDTKYYRTDEQIKILNRPLPTGSDRKHQPVGPFALDDDKTDYHY